MAEGAAADPRFARHRLIPGWRQARLRAARVVVVGVGALGNEVSRILAMAGVGSFILCDPDGVERSNLSRTVLFRDADVGGLKAEAAAAALAQLAPGVEVDPRPLPLVRGVGLGELRDASLVLGCLDSRAARLELAGRCNLVGAPAIDGGTHPWGGEVRLALEPGGPCYGCTLSAEERATADQPWSCLDDVETPPEGAAAPSSALVGAWMAQLAVRFLMALEVPAGALTVDAERGITSRVALERDPDCPLHQPIDQVRVLEVGVDDTVGALSAALGDGHGPLAWEGFQERVECRACGFAEARFGSADSRPPCPRCGAPLVPRTTLELATAPAGQTLRSLGVAPREILAVRSRTGLDWIELAADP